MGRGVAVFMRPKNPVCFATLFAYHSSSGDTCDFFKYAEYDNMCEMRDLFVSC